MSPIHVAAGEGDLEEVRRLLQQDPRLLDSSFDPGDGITPLQMAAFRRHLDVVRYLLDQGADPNSKNTAKYDRGFTPLHWTTHPDAVCRPPDVNSALDTVELLVSRGADPTITTGSGKSPLMFAADVSDVGVVRYLLSFKSVRARIDAQDTYGRTALWRSAFDGSKDVMKVLLAAGANPMVVAHGRDHMTPMDIAQERRYLRCYLERYDQCIPLLQVSDK